MVVIAICGVMGKGKTATATYMATQFYLQGFKLHSNYSIFLPQPDGSLRSIARKVQTFEDFDKVYEGYAVFDELWSWMDARSSMSGANMFLSDILLKSRKRHFNLILTAQHLSQLDVRIRNVTQYVIYPEAIITNPVTGERVEIKQHLLKPVSLKPYLNFTTIHAYVCEAHPQTGFFNRVVDEFEFPLAPAAAIYNTDEEVAALGSGAKEGKGMKTEEEARIMLTKLNTNPQATLLRVEESGQDRDDTYDVETHDCIINGKQEGLVIYDAVSLQKIKSSMRLDMSMKSKKKFLHIKEVRGCPIYFVFHQDGRWYRASCESCWALLKQKVGWSQLFNLSEFLANKEEVPVTIY